MRSGLLEVDSPGGGRGNSPVVRLRFAEGDHEVADELNADLFETVLSYSRCRGSARLLLGVLAALADGAGTVKGIKSDELSQAAGIGDSSYRRARRQLLATGEVRLDTAGGGRALTNRWTVRDPRGQDITPLAAPAPRRMPTHEARPLLAATRPRVTDGRSSDGVPASAGTGRNRPELNGVSGTNPGQSRTVNGRNGPELNGVMAQNPGQSRTVLAKTPPETPPQTPPPKARAGKEPQNLRTTPPDPPQRGQHARATIVEHYVSERGRRRRRTIPVDLNAVARELRPPGATDGTSWQRIHEA